MSYACKSSGISVRIEIMEKAQLHPQFLMDEKGQKTSVLLPVGEFYELLEDLEDLAVCAERRDEPTIPMEEVIKELGLDGLV
jgi:hypothetical protein